MGREQDWPQVLPSPTQQMHRVEVGSNHWLTARWMTVCLQESRPHSQEQERPQKRPTGPDMQYVEAQETALFLAPQPQPPHPETLHEESQSSATNAIGLPCTVVFSQVLSPHHHLLCCRYHHQAMQEATATGPATQQKTEDSAMQVPTNQGSKAQLPLAPWTWRPALLAQAHPNYWSIKRGASARGVNWA